MDPVTRVRELSALYRKYMTEGQLVRTADLVVPNYTGDTIYYYDVNLRCCPIYNALIIILTKDYRCFDGGAKLFHDGTVMIKSTCIYMTAHPMPYAFNYTQYWKPTPGICNYKLDAGILFDLRCSNYNATCAD
jgi:hypothetical protein